MKSSLVSASLLFLASISPGRAQSFGVTVTNGSISGAAVSFQVSAPGATSVTNFNVEGTADFSNWSSVTNGTSWPTNGVLSVVASFTNTAEAFRATVGTNQSINALGFISQTVSTGIVMFANQLECPGGNDLDTILTNVPIGSTAYKWDPSGQAFTASTLRPGLSWSRDFSFGPGEGIEFRPGGTTPVTISFIGNVPQGSLSTTLYTNGSIVSTFWPTTGDLTSIQHYPASTNDIAYRLWTDGSGNYNTYQYVPGGWSPSLSPRAGEAFWYYATNSGASWSKTLSIW